MIPTEVFPASHLPWKLQINIHTGGQRKLQVEQLQSCPIRKLTQWKCEPVGEQVQCWPIERFFRTCKEIMVEVTEFDKALE